jgi:putative oxidoreductase
MLRKLISWSHKVISLDIAALLLRLWLGGMMIFHSYDKLFNAKVMNGFANGLEAKLGLPLPEVMAYLAKGSEFFGGILLVIGLMTRPALCLVAITMIVAAFVWHSADPFADKELAFNYLLLAIALWFTGPGKASFDKALS